ncbi:endospore germination permease [Cohnella zeiphila]|uniref:Endospore germination permease n=1 Tax=Cohnella zeiphila TaxID=2761120 RepID=A0A7X0STN4_9BACL|nr:endospore germination permease [Cohnella zeiphila]
MRQKLSFLQISLIFILSIGLMNHVVVIPVLLDVSRRDAWLSVLLASLLFLPVFAMIAFIIQRTGSDGSILQWLRIRYGKLLSVPVAALLAPLLLLSAYVTGKDMNIWFTYAFLPQTPTVILAVTFLGLACYLAIQGIRSIAFTSAVLLPPVVLFGDFVMTFNFSRKDYALLMPLFEYGSKPMWEGVLYIGSGFLELTFFLLLQPHLTDRITKRGMIVLGLILAGLTIGPTTGALAEFGPIEGSLLRFPAFEEWRIVKIGNYVEHVDFLSIFQWMSGAFVRISLALYLLTEIFGRGKVWLTVSLAGLLAVGISIRFSDPAFVQFIKTVYFPIHFYALLGLVVVLYFLVLLTKPNERRASHAS